MGIAHVHGRSDADAVFGMEYAQAEDDFNRVEMNYLNALGRVAETEGAPAIWRAPHSPRNCRTASIKRRRPYMPGWQ